MFLHRVLRQLLVLQINDHDCLLNQRSNNLMKYIFRGAIVESMGLALESMENIINYEA